MLLTHNFESLQEAAHFLRSAAPFLENTPCEMKFNFFNFLEFLLAKDNVELSLELDCLKNVFLVVRNGFLEIEPLLLLFSLKIIKAIKGFSKNSFGVETLGLILDLFVEISPHPLVQYLSFVPVFRKFFNFNMHFFHVSLLFKSAKSRGHILVKTVSVCFSDIFEFLRSVSSVKNFPNFLLKCNFGQIF